MTLLDIFWLIIAVTLVYRLRHRILHSYTQIQQNKGESGVARNYLGLIHDTVEEYTQYHCSHGNMTDSDAAPAWQFILQAYEKKFYKKPNEQMLKKLEECFERIRNNDPSYIIPDWLIAYAQQWPVKRE